MVDIAAVIVNYNSGMFLRKCVESLQLSDTDIDIIIVDNDSSDDSAEFLMRSDSKRVCRIVFNKTNRGFSAAVNQGVNATSATYVLLINPDCVVQSHTVSNLKSVLQKEKCGAVGGLVFGFDGKEQAGCRRHDPSFSRSVGKLSGTVGARLGFSGVDQTAERLPLSPIEVDAVSGAFMLVDRIAFDTVGGMDEGYFLHFEDLDLCRRLRAVGARVVFVPGVSVFHRQGASSQLRPLKTEWHKHLGMCRYWLKFSRMPRFLNWGFNVLVAVHFVYRSMHWAVGRCFRLWSTKQRVLTSIGDTGNLGVVVFGPRTDVGEYVVPRLRALGLRVALISRRPHHMAVGRDVAVLHPEYLNKVPKSDLLIADSMICAMPIWQLPQYEAVLRECNIKRLVAFSSTSIRTKANSTNLSERETVQRLIDGERWLKAFAEQGGINCLIVRPTMIYGGRFNQSIRRIQGFIRRWRLVPFDIEAGGFRQPIHADDLSQLAACWINSGTKGVRLVSVGGRDVLSNRSLVNALFQSVGRHWQILPFSSRALRVVLHIAFRCSGGLTPSATIIDRLGADLSQSNEEAIKELAFVPRPFLL